MFTCIIFYIGDNVYVEIFLSAHIQLISLLLQSRWTKTLCGAHEHCNDNKHAWLPEVTTFNLYISIITLMMLICDSNRINICDIILIFLFKVEI